MKHHEPRLLGLTIADGEVNVLSNRITNLGAPQAGTDAARLQDIPPGFYGSTVKQTDSAQSFSKIVTFNFGSDFYITQNAPNTDEVIINLRPPAAVVDHGNLSGLDDDDHTQYTLADGTRAFGGDQSMGTNKLTNVGAPIAGTDAARLQDIPPGFYGSVVKQTDDVAVFPGIKVFAFNTDGFYVTQNAGNSDEAIINLRPPEAVTDHGALSGLADDDHSQYILVAGTRAFTGNQGVGGNKFTNLGLGSTAFDSVRYGQVILKSGANIWTANQSVGGFRLTNLGAPVDENDAVRKTDLDNFYLIVRDTPTDIQAKSLRFSAADFDVDGVGDQANISIDDSIARTADINQFYGVLVREGVTGGENVHTIQFQTLFFNVLLAGSGVATVQLDQAQVLQPGEVNEFYGINVRHSDGTQAFKGIDTLVVNTDDFYLTQNAPDTDTVTLNFRGVETAETPTLTKSLTLAEPTSAEDATVFLTPLAITITKVYGVLRGSGSPSVTFNVYHNTSRSAAGNTVFSAGQTLNNTTTADEFTPNDDDTVPADSFIWIETSALSGTVQEAHWTIEYTED